MNDEPKDLRFAAALADAERRIADALPDVVDGLIARTREGDTRAAIYLLDRFIGRAVGAKSAPANDRALPYTEDEDQDDRREQESKTRLRRLIDGLGAPKGA